MSNFFNEVVELVIQKMEAQVEAILEVYPLPPGWELQPTARDMQKQWNRMSLEQREAWVQRVGGPEQAGRILGGMGLRVPSEPGTGGA